MPDIIPATDMLSLSLAREQFSALVNRVLMDHQPVYLTRHGNRVVALISAADLDTLLQARVSQDRM